jgi:hypothetical protein
VRGDAPFLFLHPNCVPSQAPLRSPEEEPQVLLHNGASGPPGLGPVFATDQASVWSVPVPLLRSPPRGLKVSLPWPCLCQETPSMWFMPDTGSHPGNFACLVGQVFLPSPWNAGRHAAGPSAWLPLIHIQRPLATPSPPPVLAGHWCMVTNFLEHSGTFLTFALEALAALVVAPCNGFPL